MCGAKQLILNSVDGWKEYDFNFALYYASLLIFILQLTVVTHFQRIYINRFVGVGVVTEISSCVCCY
jgi:hypothetical protein